MNRYFYFDAYDIIYKTKEDRVIACRHRNHAHKDQFYFIMGFMELISTNAIKEINKKEANEICKQWYKNQ